MLFGGTSEQHVLLRTLASRGLAITVCVAGEYGRALLPAGNEKLKVRIGRLTAGQMIAMIQEKGFACIVDATHPYALAASANIKAAAAETRTPYLRLLREKNETGTGIIVPSLRGAAEMIGKLNGAALITTGSKELAAFTQIPDFKERIYLRVLPAVGSIQACLSLGFPAGRIIAMQGPFSKELNVALMRQFAIKILVTKESGREGGFPEKREAARELGVQLIVLRRPQEEGLLMTEIVPQILALMEEKR